MNRVTEETLASRELWRLYPGRDAFIRRRRFSWSAELVNPGQIGPPYRTTVVAEATSVAELMAQLLELQR